MPTLDLSQNVSDFRLNDGDWPRFWPRWGPFQRARMVLASWDGASWTITDPPGADSVSVDDTSEALFSWSGGRTHVFDDVNGLAAALTAKGYVVT